MFKRIEIELMENGSYQVRVTKAFAPEHGGGEETFTELGGKSPHRALDVARGMVTCSPSLRSEAAAIARTAAGCKCACHTLGLSRCCITCARVSSTIAAAAATAATERGIR